MTSWLRNPTLVMVLLVAACVNGFLLSFRTPTTSTPRDARSVHERIAAWTPTAEERRFQQIPWTRDLEGALAEARKSHRLVLAVVSNGDFCSGRL